MTCRNAFAKIEASATQPYAFRSASLNATLTGDKIISSAVLSWTESPEKAKIVASVLEGICNIEKAATGNTRVVQLPLDAATITTLCERLKEFNAVEPAALKQAIDRYEYRLQFFDRGRTPRPAIAAPL